MATTENIDPLSAYLPEEDRSRPGGVVLDRPLASALVYLAGITAAELVTFLVSPAAGIAIDLIVLLSLIVHSSLAAQESHRHLYLALAVAPLIRIVAISMPLSQFAQIYWYVLISIPLFAATIIGIRIINYHPSEIGLNLRKLPYQLIVALAGVGFAVAEYRILRPEPLIATLTVGHMLLPILVLLMAGFVEELAFRGLMHRSAVQALGPWGWVYIALLYSVLFVGYMSPMQWLLALLVGLFFGWVVQKTKSLSGVILSHTMINVGFYLVIPLVAR